jgi:hypothetical protein
MIDIRANVRAYYKEIEKHAQSKIEKEIEIQNRMKELYDAYQGEKAKELEKRIKEALEEIEQGQILDKNLKEKLSER